MRVPNPTFTTELHNPVAAGIAVTETHGGATITRGPEERDNFADVPRESWQELIGEYRWYCRTAIQNDCRNLLRMVSGAEAVDWAGYKDRDHYLREGLDLDPQAVDWALTGLSIAGVEAPIGFEEAKKLGWGGARRGAGRKFKNGPATDYNQKLDCNVKPQLPRLRRAWKRATDEERAAFLAEIAP